MGKLSERELKALLQGGETNTDSTSYNMTEHR